MAFCCWVELVCLFTLCKSCHLFADLSLGSGVAGASRRMLHPNGRPAESHPGPDANHEAPQRQPRCLPEAQHAALQPRRTPWVTQVSIGDEQTALTLCRRSHANEADFHLESICFTSLFHSSFFVCFCAATSESVWSWTRMTKSVSATTSRWKSSASSWTRQKSSFTWRGQCFL